MTQASAAITATNINDIVFGKLIFDIKLIFLYTSKVKENLMLKSIAKFLTKIGRQRIILDRESNEPYLERYYVFLRDRTWFPFNVFLHKFLKSDPDDVHDHPWPYATLILKGGYYEWVPQFNGKGQKIGEIAMWRAPGHFRICSPTSYHRIELDPTVECWTLFMPGPQKREWGFLVNNKWIHNDEYIKQRTATAKH